MDFSARWDTLVQRRSIEGTDYHVNMYLRDP